MLLVGLVVVACNDTSSEGSTTTVRKSSGNTATNATPINARPQPGSPLAAAMVGGWASRQYQFALQKFNSMVAASDQLDFYSDFVFEGNTLYAYLPGQRQPDSFVLGSDSLFVSSGSPAYTEFRLAQVNENIVQLWHQNLGTREFVRTTSAASVPDLGIGTAVNPGLIPANCAWFARECVLKCVGGNNKLVFSSTGSVASALGYIRYKLYTHQEQDILQLYKDDGTSDYYAFTGFSGFEFEIVPINPIEHADTPVQASGGTCLLNFGGL